MIGSRIDLWGKMGFFLGGMMATCGIIALTQHDWLLGIFAVGTSFLFSSWLNLHCEVVSHKEEKE